MNQHSGEFILRELFFRFLENRCSKEEVKMLMEYAANEEYRGQLTALMEEADMEEEQADELLYAKHKTVIDEIASRITLPPVTEAKTRRLWYYYAAAAMAGLLLSVGAWYWYTQHFKAQKLLAANSSQTPEQAPGNKKTILVLANGASIALDSASDGLLASQGSTSVIKAPGGKLIYDAGVGQPAVTLYNSIVTPRGEQFQVTLPDGTKVWLNAASSLRFPTAFAGNTRQITLTGEAYFEVAENVSQPFIVAVNDMQVTVLGTHFNIMAYKEEAAINTTLFEGAVKVTKGNAVTLLQPGQQARATPNGNIRLVPTADLNAALAWKNQLFWFDNDDIQTVMRQVSRAYDIDVIIEGDIRRHFTGSVPRSIHVSTVLNVLQQTGGFHFAINQGKIIVTP